MTAHPTFARRRLFHALGGMALSGGCGGVRSPVDRDGRGENYLAESRIAAIEARVGGRLGVAVRDTGSGLSFAYRGAVRFPLCSTFKLLLTAAVLLRVDQDHERLSRVIRYGEAQLLEYAPITRARVAEGGLSIGDLCAAAMTFSDNTAANLLLESIGGPAGLTRYLRSWGDSQTRLDRNEPTLNEALPGDLRDTTTPAAMLGDLETLLLGAALLPSSRDQLAGWLVANTTGHARLRAGFPATWRVGDKTGTGEHGATNDVAIVWPPSSPPLLIAAYLVDSSANIDARNRALAEVGSVVASWYSSR